MIAGKYRKEEGRWCSRAEREGYKVGLWKVIQSGWGIFNSIMVLRWAMGKG